MARLQFLRQGLHDLFHSRGVRTLIVVLAVLLLAYLLLVARYRSLRRKHLRQRRQEEKRRRALREQREAELKARAARGPEEPTQRFAVIDPAERDAEDFDFSRYFDEIDTK